MKIWRNIFFGIVGFGAAYTAQAKVIRVEWDSAGTTVKQGYVIKKGRMTYAIDPSLPQNRVITDLDLAPKDEQGLVRFSGEVTLQHPEDLSKSNGLAWVHIPNRGGIGKLTKDQMEQGTTLLNVAWEFDLPETENRIRLQVPQVKQKDGTPIRERVWQTIVPEKNARRVKLTDLWLYPMVESRTSERKLVLRNSPGDKAGKAVPLDKWAIEKDELVLLEPLIPGRTYEVSYISQDPYVGGLGYAAVRDAVTWLKKGKTTPVKIQHAMAFGSSQCGRFLRDYLFLGFNQSESGQRVFEGVMAHVAGAGRLVLNERWSKPRSLAAFDTASFPFADRAMESPVNQKWSGVLENERANFFPNLMYINTGSEYWGAGRVGGLTHSNLQGDTDEPFMSSVRSYYYVGTQHGAASFPPEKLAEDGLHLNPVKADEVTEALKVAMEEWVVNQVLPPDSAVPLIREGTLVHAKDVKWPAIPGVTSPNKIKAGTSVVSRNIDQSAGPGWKMPLLVPQVDEDGNDLGGIQMPEIAVPLATATGWIHRTESMGNPADLALLRGSWIPFEKTKAERLAKKDPRLSIEERYPNKVVYLEAIKKEVFRLIEKRLLLLKHEKVLLDRAEAQWNYLHNVND